MTTAKLKEDNTVTGDDYKDLREEEKKIEDLQTKEHQKEKEETRPDDENFNREERDSSVNNEETAAQRNKRNIQLYIQHLEHMSTCNSSKCSSSHCSGMNDFLEHISSCRQRFERECIVCRFTSNLIRIHAQSCKTSNCKVPRCERLKKLLHEMRSGQQNVINNPTPAADTAVQKLLGEQNLYTSRQNIVEKNQEEEESIKRLTAIRKRIATSILSPDEQIEAFDEFMLWSLSDEADLTPKKFAKHASGIARLLIAGEISIQTILLKRSVTLTKLEVEAKEFDYKECLQLLLDEMRFDRPKYKIEFRKQLDEALSRRRWNVQSRRSPMLLEVLYDSYQEVLSKWQNTSKLYVDKDSIFIGTSKAEFDKYFHYMYQEMFQNPAQLEKRSDIRNYKLFHKFYTQPMASIEYVEKGTVYAQKLLNSVLTLYLKMHSCWSCDQLHGKGNETKSLMCAGCKCAVYCSKECQVEHWKDSHEKCCGEINLVWSAYECRKKRVGKALSKEKIFTKPIIINGKKKECCLRPCASLDYILCANSRESNTNARRASMDFFYKNVATLACGGKHVLFGNETISSELEEKIRTSYEDILSEFKVGSDEIDAFKSIAEMLQYKESDLTKQNLMSEKRSLSVDRFITLYICWEHFSPFDKFEIEANLLKELQSYHDEIE